MPLILVIAILGVSVVLTMALTVATIGVTKSPNSVTIERYWYQWSSPPSKLCDGYASHKPYVPFAVPLGTQFNISSTYACWPGLNGSYVIQTVRSLTRGFTVVSSTLPVIVRSDPPAAFNVTVLAPNIGYVGDLALEITTGQRPAVSASP